MLRGRRNGFTADLVLTHSASCHSKPSSDATIEQFSGRNCIANPYGSDLRNKRPSRPRISNLYSVPTPISAMNNSQTPETPRPRITLRRPSQSLNGPTTLTLSAFGAHTAKLVPFTPD